MPRVSGARPSLRVVASRSDALQPEIGGPVEMTWYCHSLSARECGSFRYCARVCGRAENRIIRLQSVTQRHILPGSTSLPRRHAGQIRVDIDGVNDGDDGVNGDGGDDGVNGGGDGENGSGGRDGRTSTTVATGSVVHHCCCTTCSPA